jgi:predicted outer membrane protein
MKGKTMAAKIMAALAALIALLAAPMAQAAAPDVQRFTFENELDPGLSAQVSGP